MPTITTNTPAASIDQSSTKEWSLIEIVEFCNKANSTAIEFQFSSMELMNNKMSDQESFQNDCNNRTDSAKSQAESMNGFNIGMTVLSVATIPLAIAASCFVGPEAFAADMGLVAAARAGFSGAAKVATTCVDITGGASSLTTGTGLGVTQAQFGQSEKNIQTDTGAIQNGGSQVKQLGDAISSIMKAEQSQGQIVSTCINNTSQASVFKRK